MRLLILIEFLLLLAGCFNGSVILRHPQTGKTAKCGPYFTSGASSRASAVARELGCVEDYKRQGYERVME